MSTSRSSKYKCLHNPSLSYSDTLGVNTLQTAAQQSLSLHVAETSAINFIRNAEGEIWQEATPPPRPVKAGTCVIHENSIFLLGNNASDDDDEATLDKRALRYFWKTSNWDVEQTRFKVRGGTKLFERRVLTNGKLCCLLD